MKFISIITKHTSEEMDNIVSQLDSISFELMVKLYNSFQFVEYVTEDGCVAMYACIEEKHIERIMAEYIKLEIVFSYEDITKQVLFGKYPELKAEDENTILAIIINEFVEENLDTNTVLDKISEIGYHTLTKRDLSVLQAC